MIITDTLFVIVGVVVGLGLAIWFLIEQKWSEWGAAFMIMLFSGLISGWLVSLPAKDLIVLGQNHEKKFYMAYGFPLIESFDGEGIDTRGLDLRIGGKYIFNCSCEDIVVYAVKYGDSGIFKRNGRNEPDPIFISSECYDKVPKIPDYWFKDPPENIIIEDDAFIVLLGKIFGSFHMKWFVTNYPLE